MELSKISRILVNIKERSRNNVTATQTKHYPCHLKNVNVDALELLEVMFKNESNMGVGNDGKQVYIHYSSLFKDQANTVHATRMCKTILIQGEPAVGKTMLCMSIVEEWASGKQFQEFQVVLLLPLMSRDVASATSLSELLHVLYTDFNADTCNQVATYLRSGESKILIIADGWEDLPASQCEIGSFLHSLLFSSDIIPTTSITVLITSRPGCIQLNIVKLIERFITLTGFEKNAIEYIIQSEFEGDFKRIHYLTAQLNDNPLIESICSTPLILAIVCDLCRSNNAEPLPNTMTELYAKLTWALIIASTKCNLRDPYINVLSSHHDLPEELQQSWWAVCELAFRNIEKGHNHTLLQSDTVALSSLKLKISSYFGLIKPIPESEDASSISFLHPHFEEYLAALHLGKQPQKAQLKFMHELALNIGCKGRIASTFWHFFISFYVREVVNVNPDIITLALKALSIACCSNKQKYCIELCHFSFEAKNHVVNHQIVKAMSIASNKLLKFGNPRNIHDISAMIYVIQNIMQICNVEINFQGCQLKSEHINGLAKALWEKSSIVQVKGLNLSNIKLNHSIAVDFFSKAATTLKFLRILILSNCQIGTTIDVKAILSALQKSSCQTLSHLDLSFNHISIPFLETLQQHIEFHATFESLQDFSLKGSLESDVSVSFLVNFSETLSSKCKCLRRLDLSDNNLGKPGNSDLRKIISLLLCLGRAFNLCLSKEYTSDIDEEFVRIMEDSINGKEMINHTMAHGVIVGPGRSGKNTLMNRLMGSGPPEPDTISPSTGVLENIVKVEVKKLCTVATAVSNLEWKKLKYDEEALELIMTTVRYHSVKTNVPKPITVNSIRFCKQHSQKSLIGVTDSIKSSHPSRVLSPNEITKYKIQERFISSRSISEYEGKEGLCTPADVKPEDIFKRALNLRGMDALRQHLESSWSLYLTNTGGQIEFQEHLPLLVSGPSIFFVTFPLHFDLKECYYVRYVYPDGQVATYKSPTSLLEELLQMLATINTSTFVSDQQRYSETGIKPKIFFVGTYKDFLPAESAERIIQEKDKLLQKYIRQTSLFDHGSVQFAEPPRQLIFTVNNLSKDNEQFQKIRLAVQKTVEKNIHDFTVECPSSWLVLSLILRAKHKSDQILSFDKCFNIAQECGITDHEELNQALSFIHSRLGLVQYYNIEGLNTQVVVDPQILFDKITDLIVKTFTCDNVEVKEMEDFCQRGIIPEAVMQKLSSKSSSDSQLPFIWLAKLLNYLKIAALFEDKDGVKYFFPSALCHAPEFHFNQPSLSYLWPPLLVGFKCGFCPRGVPGALIKYLMTNEMKSKRRWNIIPNRIFRNQVSFAIEALDIITLRILPTHLEICYDSERDSVHVVSKESNLTKRTCEVACMQIMKGMSTITSQCKECDYFFVGFYCTLDECQTHEHPAELEWDGENPSMLSCKVANRRGNLPKGYDIWNLQKKQRSGI